MNRDEMKTGALDFLRTLKHALVCRRPSRNIRQCRRADASVLFSGILWAMTNLPALGAAAAGADGLPPNFPQVELPAKANGEAAIAALGGQLPALAAFYKVTEADLRNRLRRDRSLWVDARGRLFYVCNFGLPPNEEATGAAELLAQAAPFSYDQTFRLHSRPGASKVIYLDFDGHDASTTSWGSDAIARPYDIDGSPYTFSTTERDRIQYIWQRVAEDFLQYDVDVTTEDPGVEALRKTSAGDTNYGTRVVIGGSSTDWYGAGAGGVAYIGSFDWNTDTPCWAFAKSVSDSEKNVAEVISHEAGHTLNLGHDGTASGAEYYSGQGNWAPIMGVGYSKPIVQWSKGEYAGANNGQDDLAVMLGEGISYRTDDHGDSIAASTALSGFSRADAYRRFFDFGMYFVFTMRT